MTVARLKVTVTCFVYIEKENKMDIGVPELLIVLVIIVLVFGPGRIAKTMGEVGQGLKSFREGISKPKEETNPESPSEVDKG